MALAIIACLSPMPLDVIETTMRSLNQYGRIRHAIQEEAGIIQGHSVFDGAIDRTHQGSHKAF